MPTNIDINLWQQRIQRCIDLQASKCKDRKEIIKLYQGSPAGDLLTGKRKSELNFLFEYVRLVKGVSYARNPYIFIRATSNKYVPFAETMEIVCNYYVRELKTKQKVKSCLGDGVMQPPGFIGIGYRGDIEITGKKQNLFYSDLMGEGEKEKTPEEMGIFDETIKNNDIFLRYISSWNIVWPDGYHDLRDSPYMIEIEPVRLLDLFSNPMYKASKFDLRGSVPTNVKQVRTVPYTMKANIPLATQRYNIDEETIIKRLFHVWDKRDRLRFTLAEGFHNDTLFERKWNYLIEGFPFYPLIFNEIPPTDTEANSYPLSDIIPMLPQLRDLSTINDAILRHGKRAGTIILAKKGALGQEEITNIQNAGDIDLVELESISEDRLKTFTTPALPRDWYAIRSLIIEDLMRISGFQQLLAQVKGIETATESENLKIGERVLTSEKTDTVEDFIKDIFRGVAGLAWQFLPKDRISQIVGRDVTEEEWPTLPEDEDEARRVIQRELSFRIDAGSTRPPKDEAVERKQWSDLAFGIKAAFPNRIKDDKFLTQLLKKFDFKDIESMIITYDDQEVAAAQEENKLLMQGQRQIISPNENDMLHLQVHSQVYQMPMVKPTKEMDEHIDTHAKNMEMKNPKANPQRGDTKISPQTTQPELRRRGVPDYADLTGAATTTQKGTGVNI